jgi:hypothetical protein
MSAHYQIQDGRRLEETCPVLATTVLSRAGCGRGGLVSIRCALRVSITVVEHVDMPKTCCTLLVRGQGTFTNLLRLQAARVLGTEPADSIFRCFSCVAKV